MHSSFVGKFWQILANSGTGISFLKEFRRPGVAEKRHENEIPCSLSSVMIVLMLEQIGLYQLGRSTE